VRSVVVPADSPALAPPRAADDGALAPQTSI
jgi:hypothetical protein